MPTEKQLDLALEEALRTDTKFLAWFVGKTKFRDKLAAYDWSRTDYPWCYMQVPSINPESGAEETKRVAGETDILLVFTGGDHEKFALHIENKLAGGRFTQLQPEMYQHRAKLWVKNPKYHSYVDWDTVLVAPSSFVARFGNEASKFGAVITHEEIAEQGVVAFAYA